MTETNNYPNNERDEKYSAGLQAIRDEVAKIIDRIGDKFDELLTDKAARFLILKTIQKYKVGKNTLRYFPNQEAATEFFTWLTGTLHKPYNYSDKQIGEYCTALFLAYDKCMPEKLLYSRTVGKALNIVYSRFPESPLFTLIENENLKLEDVLNDCEDPPQNNIERIGYLKECLNIVNAYLDAEGPLNEIKLSATSAGSKTGNDLRSEETAVEIDSAGSNLPMHNTKIVQNAITEPIPPIDTTIGTWWTCKNLTRLREIDSNSKREGIAGTRKILKDLKTYLKKHKRGDIAATLIFKDDRIITSIPYGRMFLQK
jgi:hypothetical protein